MLYMDVCKYTILTKHDILQSRPYCDFYKIQLCRHGCVKKKA